MGREVKRVAMDFNWPLKKTWGGYLNPFYVHCADCTPCGGSGYSPQAKLLRDQWYGNAPFDPEMTGSSPFTPTHQQVRSRAEWNVTRSPSFYGYGEPAIVREAMRLCSLYNQAWSHHLDQDDVAALLKADRLYDFTREPRTEEQKEIVRNKLAAGGNSWLPESNGYVPTPQEVNDWSIEGFGHGGIICWVCVRSKAERLGVPVECATCAGKGSIWDSPESEQSAEDWLPVEPPVGAGWQMWETTSEGSPISPVFATAEDLGHWLADTNASAFGASGATFEQWVAMIDAGGAVSAVSLNDGRGLISGVEAVTAVSSLTREQVQP
jgi:hypothetical protein